MDVESGSPVLVARDTNWIMSQMSALEVSTLVVRNIIDHSAYCIIEANNRDDVYTKHNKAWCNTSSVPRTELP